MIHPTEKDGWYAFRQPDGLCELHDRGLKPTEGVLASCKVIEEDDIPTYETSVLRAVAHEWVKVENFTTVMRVVFNYSYAQIRHRGEYIYFPKKEGLPPLKTKCEEGSVKQVRIIPRQGCYVIELVYESCCKEQKVDNR